MAQLKNVFSWSHSASEDFEVCRRRRYWGKYAHWNGWSRNADALTQTAYRLGKMTSRHGIMGEAAEMCVMWVLKEKQAGRDRTADEAFAEIAKPFLRRCWDESTQGVWRDIPKACCLHEHYYPQFHDKADREMMFEIADIVKRCTENFIANTLPRLAHVTPEQEVPVTVVGMGDPEQFTFEGVKVYAIPDYVYTEGDTWHIIDWKSGKAKDLHQKQVGIYALWANEKHGVAPENIRVTLEYLQFGKSVTASVTEADLETTRETIRHSVADMADYLEDGDIVRNVALPKEEWELALDPRSCRLCNFYELCKPELGEV